MFTEFTQNLLIDAGWVENRKVDINNDVKLLKAEGYHVSTNVVNFLEEFSGLRIKHPHHEKPEIIDEFHFIITEIVQNTYYNWIEEYSQRIQKKVCVIGEAYRGYMALMMCNKGAVYGGCDDILFKIGISGADAIEALCQGRELEEVS